MKLKDNKKAISPYCLCHSLFLSHLEAELKDEKVRSIFFFFPLQPLYSPLSIHSK